MHGGDNDKTARQMEQLSLQSRLQKVRDAGVELLVDGEYATPGEIAEKCLQEQNVYMADYVLGTQGRLEQLRFDRINPE